MEEPQNKIYNLRLYFLIWSTSAISYRRKIHVGGKGVSVIYAQIEMHKRQVQEER